MRRLKNPVARWIALMFTAGLPRILGAFFLPNAFGDAYVYIRDIGVLSTKLLTRTFGLTDLYGFWLPLYQFICALINVFVHNGFYVGKVVSAIFGIGVCLLVYRITLSLTANRMAALLAFGLIALNPLHILYSASAMTDVPHAFLVLAALDLVLNRSWIAAAVLAALAGLTRVESWIFIALIPTIQILKERRLSVMALLILAIPPLFWFYISWKATGNGLACFVARQQYRDWLLTANPTLAYFSVSHVIRDGATLLVSAGSAVVPASFVAGEKVSKAVWKLLMVRKPSNEALSVLAPAMFFFAFFGLLGVAYLTHQQPIIFPRYGLILFSLGVPILAWTLSVVKERKPQRAKLALITVAAICFFDASVQLVYCVGVLKQYSAQRSVAEYLREHLDRSQNTRIFCDEGTVQALSGIQTERFISSSEAPRDRDAFLAFLEDRKVEYLVVVKKPDSTPSKLFPNSEYGEPIGPFEPVIHGYTEFLPTNIWLYRVRDLSKRF